jgi:hypothetical protein
LTVGALVVVVVCESCGSLLKKKGTNSSGGLVIMSIPQQGILTIIGRNVFKKKGPRPCARIFHSGDRPCCSSQWVGGNESQAKNQFHVLKKRLFERSGKTVLS